ncbi:glycosyltransferase family 2 protein [Pseudoalteromonas maricaloris]|uniref:glycosyltransferase family 2 protein n=1 Tax=Pseudoalteromonas maricaloris TaxID=184924 RepID=UPI00029AF342|nr:glycosyltransferase family 2 protein [Pseudoalteromonas flavipulchra]
MDQKVKVSVCVVTYNQERYIKKCIESILSQEGNFELEVIVSDDGSKDGTRKLLDSFRDNKNLKLHFQENNLGPYNNFLFVHEQAKGDLICHCDGDDFWYPGKLEAQVSYMQNNPDCNVSWTRVDVEFSGGVSLPDRITQGIVNQKFYRGDVLQLISIGMNSTKMYRARAIDDTELPVVDYYSNVELLGDGYASFASEERLALYRAGVGISSSNSESKMILLKTMGHFLSKYPKYRPRVNAALILMLMVELKNRNWLCVKNIIKIIRFDVSIFKAPYYLFSNINTVKSLRLPRG